VSKRISEANYNKKRSREVLFGSFLIIISFLLFISLSSYFFTWEYDQSNINKILDRNIDSKNILKKIGSEISHIFIYEGFGASSLIFSLLLCITGLSLFFEFKKLSVLNTWSWGLFYTILLSLILSQIKIIFPFLGGSVGYEISDFIIDYTGIIGFWSIILFLILFALVTHFKILPKKIAADFWKQQEKDIESDKTEDESIINESIISNIENLDDDYTKTEVDSNNDNAIKEKGDDVVMEISKNKEEETVEDVSANLVKKHGLFDPTLELSGFRPPNLEQLKDYGSGSIKIDEKELESNKNTIIETLRNYKIEIAKIKANIGPTVTLYEIVPAAGIRISKIKNLEDDIALSLSALGIRIIAPIPGKGTVGIEVPNNNPTIVSMKSVISSQKFQNAEMELPIAFGKTISNETFTVDLVKMPHLLMAGATGQGKSVGLNVILTSLLYKKHPSEVKFILVDPKKVELNIYNKIERHYLAKLPNSEESIITDNKKVIYTLNSLCIEMDNRYELLKNAMCRNIREYNQKYKLRKLNPDNGHRFLPYIVLVVDEFADLIMSAGKEVETPIARLAQLARAIGIHLIIATQRPSVNVITGIIKANFPARIAFRVTSKIDSRTILDVSGADQLIGRGDMLYTQGNELIRIQCAFVDTPEVEKISEFIGSQKGYPDAHLLPEFSGEENEIGEINIEDRDELFEEAAKVIVIAQQGSASLIQRKLKLGYNRAGRIIDQMEAAGIVGPFEGSKARQVLIPDLNTLEQYLSNDS
jgi:S-DNA-T family DNA segregation ATPase FtsK/SpoIIIE